jgi:hypothetical protein
MFKVICSLVAGIFLALCTATTAGAAPLYPITTPWSHDLVTNQLLVLMREGASRSDVLAAAVSLGARDLQPAGAPGNGSLASRLISIQMDISQKDIIAKALKARPDVEVVAPVNRYALTRPPTPDVVIPGTPAPYPNDVLYPQQTYLTAMGAQAAWGITKGDGQLLVALVNTGMNPCHPDLRQNRVPGYNFADNSADDSDPVGVGTLSAGTIAATFDNAEGIAGLAQVRYMPCRVVDAQGNTDTALITTAMLYAADRGAKVIVVIALGLAGDPAVEWASAQAKKAGAVVVSGMGTPNPRISLASTAAKPSLNTIFVGANPALQARPDWSSEQLGLWGYATTLAAPSAAILSTFNNDPNFRYLKVSGTDLSGSLVGGLAALLLSANPALTPAAVRSLLVATTNNMGYPTIYGAGMVRADRAVDVANHVAHMISPAPGSTLTNSVATFRWQAPVPGATFTVRIGKTPGSAEYFSGAVGSVTERTFSKLPHNGSVFWVRLSSTYKSSYGGSLTGYTISLDASYVAVQGAPATLTSPAIGSQLGDDQVLFEMTDGIAVKSRRLTVFRTGLTPYFDAVVTGNTTVSNLPGDGKPLRVRLTSSYGDTSTALYYDFTAVKGEAATLLSPADGSTIAAITPFTIQLSSGKGVRNAIVSIGKTRGSGALFSRSLGNATSVDVPGLNLDNVVVYIRVTSQISGVGNLVQDYTVLVRRP